MDIAIRSWIATILFLSHTGLEWIAISGLATLKKICVKQKKKALDRLFRSWIAGSSENNIYMSWIAKFFNEKVSQVFDR